jgi:hypothetical protein
MNINVYSYVIKYREVDICIYTHKYVHIYILTNICIYIYIHTTTGLEDTATTAPAELINVVWTINLP